MSDKFVAEREPQIGVCVRLGVRLRMQSGRRGRASVGGVNHQDAGAVAGGIDQQFRRESPLVPVVVDVAMPARRQHEEAEPHHWARSARAARIGRWLFVRFNRRQHTGPGFFKRAALEHDLVGQIGWVAN